jgi:hypothetical protein
MSGSVFKLSDEQMEKFKKWKDEKGYDADKKCSAMGGAYTISFTPTSVIDIVKVTCHIDGSTIDLTDYENL